MMKMTKMILVAAVLVGTTLGALADRGIGKRSKNRVELNVNAANGLRNSISLNLKSGLKYTGSLLSKQYTGGNMLENTLITYQKGNTVYIIPYKQVQAVPDLKQGYTGMKLIIRPH